LSNKSTSKNPSTPQGKRGRLRKKKESAIQIQTEAEFSKNDNEIMGNQLLYFSVFTAFALSKDNFYFCYILLLCRYPFSSQSTIRNLTSKIWFVVFSINLICLSHIKVLCSNYFYISSPFIFYSVISDNMQTGAAA
jgi:hypothetical protein